MKMRRWGMLISAFICVYLRFRRAGATILAETSARNGYMCFAGFGSFASGGCTGGWRAPGTFIINVT
jgi:hypothetical protein